MLVFSPESRKKGFISRLSMGGAASRVREV